jgi:Caspase domain
MTTQPRDFALVVGIDDYPRYSPLKGAVADATDFNAWLVDDPRGGGLDPAHVRLITSEREPLPGRPLQLEIDDQLQGILDAAQALGGGRRLYFYFGGHGFANKLYDVALCLVAWSESMRSLAISSQSYRDVIADYGCFAEIVMLLDCCRTRKVAAQGMPPYNPRPSPAGSPVRVFIAYAADHGNASFEATAAGAPAPDVRGHFTRALLAGLWGGAADPGGGVSSTKLKQYLEAETVSIASAAQHQQKPEVLDGLPAGTMFGRALPVLELRIEIDAARDGTVVLEGPGLEEVRRSDTTPPPWEVDLTGGTHMLHDLKTGELRELPFRPAKARQNVQF